MHSTEEVTAELPPAPTKTPPRPENTVTTVLVMLLLSAAVLWGLDRTLRENDVVVQRWDFTAPSDSAGPWTFPEGGQTRDANGIAYLAAVTAPGPTLEFPIETSAVSTVRANVQVTSVVSDEPVPFELEWYWASPEDVAAAAGKWPFSTERGATFVVPDRHQPDVHVLHLDQHPKWTGSVAKAFIAVKLVSPDTGPSTIVFRSFEFLE